MKYELKKKNQNCTFRIEGDSLYVSHKWETRILLPRVIELNFKINEEESSLKDIENLRNEGISEKDIQYVLNVYNFVLEQKRAEFEKFKKSEKYLKHISDLKILRENFLKIEELKEKFFELIPEIPTIDIEYSLIVEQECEYISGTEAYSIRGTKGVELMSIKKEVYSEEAKSILNTFSEYTGKVLFSTKKELSKMSETDWDNFQSSLRNEPTFEEIKLDLELSLKAKTDLIKNNFRIFNYIKNNMNIEIINMTPHSVIILNENNEILKSIPASGNTIRLSAKIENVDNINDINISKTVFGEPVGLPKYQEGTFYIVSQLVKSALPQRTDLLVPAEVVRDTNGNIIGCRSLGC